jgi:Kef-type K+ transport system membrane component KefB
MGELIATIIAEFFEWIFISVIFDIIIKLPGYWIANLLFKSKNDRSNAREINPDGLLSICCGLSLWAVIGGIGYKLYQVWK